VIFLTSSEKRVGRDELLGYIEGINKNLKLEADSLKKKK